METKKNLNIVSNYKHFPKLVCALRYCRDYFSGKKHKIRPAIKRKIGKFESFWQYAIDYFSGNKYGYIKSCEKQK